MNEFMPDDSMEKCSEAKKENIKERPKGVVITGKKRIRRREKPKKEEKLQK